ncbi:hypothetical protein [Prosthecobacter dejongeii]|uniref:Uncharacterized protein n=1 Tax=Prosthecobacter dejongeii TaxID=48465 RepID=A0A7W8DSZ7_9BACT|nr:hypothetical protein [Prosthecobacter dejongeii]MBB5040371.1 hypothetical protein [Prosthecobacter dejongeii]
MPPQDPSDDFSQLPTADGGSRQNGHAQSQAPRQQTRIGPRSNQPAPQAAPPEEAPIPLSDDWQELLQNPASESTDAGWIKKAFPTSLQEDLDLPQQPPAPRRTIVGRRAPLVEDSPPPVELPPEVPVPPRRTIVAKRSEETPLETLTPAAPEPPSQSKEIQTANPKKESTTKTSASKGQKAASKSASLPESIGLSENQAPSHAEIPNTAEVKEAPSTTETKVPEKLSPVRQYWERWGGKALSLSVAVHALLLLSGALIVVSQVADKQVDFLPGGGTQQGAEASQALEHKIQQKKSPWLKKAMPVRKIAAVGSISDIVLPDDVPDLLDLPKSKDFLSDSKLTAGMGLAGSGNGFGKGIGMGGKTGLVFQPFSMFGMQIKAKRLGLVLDVSTSMAPHLPRVIEEVDKVAKGSIVILYFGCGLEAPPPQGIDGDEVYSTSSVEFEKFWRLGGATLFETRKFRIDPKKEIQSEAIYRILSKRPQTYFIHNTGLGYTWLALLNDKLRTADGIYWFSDFQDRVDFKQVTIVRENLERRKQRLYMHAYMRGSAYDLVKTQLVDPTKGDVKLEE